MDNSFKKTHIYKDMIRKFENLFTDAWNAGDVETNFSTIVSHISLPNNRKCEVKLSVEIDEDEFEQDICPEFPLLCTPPDSEIKKKK